MALPHFFVVGAPKAGTTALHAALAPHPQLFLSRVKEPKYFLCDGAPPVPPNGPGDAHSAREWIWRRDAYEALFAAAPPGTRRGESTPLYLASPAALGRIKRAVPEAKLIAILRHPVDRAYSNWAHLWADGLEPIGDFVAACDAEEGRLANGWAPFWAYKRLGLYAEQLTRLFETFDRDQVHVLRYRDLVEAPSRALDEICRFLHVEPGVVSAVPGQNVSTYVDPSTTRRALQQLMRNGAAVGRHFPPQVWRKASVPLLWALRHGQRERPTLTEAQRAELTAYFADDIARLAEILDQPFDDWLSHRVGETYSVRRSWEPSGRVAS